MIVYKQYGISATYGSIFDLKEASASDQQYHLLFKEVVDQIAAAEFETVGQTLGDPISLAPSASSRPALSTFIDVIWSLKSTHFTLIWLFNVSPIVVLAFVIFAQISDFSVPLHLSCQPPLTRIAFSYLICPSVKAFFGPLGTCA